MAALFRSSGRFVQFVLVFAVFFISQTGLTAEHVVRVVSDYENLRMLFDPKHLQVEIGDTVTWVNEADEEHNVITYPDGFPKGAKPLQSQIMTAKGESWSYRFDVAGTYEYHCIPHLPMGMRGLVIVDRPSRDGDIHEPGLEEIKAYRALLLKWFDEDDFEELETDDRASAIDHHLTMN